MPPFIRYTHKTQAAEGEVESIVFINTAAIAKAVYDPRSQKLTLMVAASAVASKPFETVSIEGKEAEFAMNTIRSVS